MKSTAINIILLLITSFSFAQERIFQEVYVAGNNVNIRTEPNLQCQVKYQRNWGDKFLGARYNDKWFELIDDDNNILYGYYKYIKFSEKQEEIVNTPPPSPTETYTTIRSTPSSSPQPVISETYTISEPETVTVPSSPPPPAKTAKPYVAPKPTAIIQPDKPKPTPVAITEPVSKPLPVADTPKKDIPTPESEPVAKLSEYKDAQIELEQLTIHTQLNEKDKARAVTVYLINNHVGENIPSRLGTCMLVGEEAFARYRSLLKDDETRVPQLRGLINDIYDPLITNMIRLDIVDYWIKEEDYQKALNIIENIMEHNSESLTLPKDCENDPNKKASPQIELKNKYFLVYHMMNKRKKEDIMSKLKSLTTAKNITTQNIAKDIYGKLSGDFWQKN